MSDNLQMARRTTGAVVVLAAVASLVTWASTPAVNHDVASIAGVASRMLRGEVLYTEIPEPNPPFVFYLEALWVWAGRALGVDMLTWLHGVVVSWVLACIGLTVWVAEVVQVPTDARDRRGIYLWVVLGSLWFFGDEMGNRDPMAALCSLPYLFEVAGRREGRPVSRTLGLAIGSMAGVGVWMKPTWALLPVVAETWLAIRTRRASHLARPTFLAGAATVLAVGLWTVSGTGYLDNVARWSAAYRGYGNFALRRDLLWLLAIPPSLVVWPWLYRGSDDGRARSLFEVAGLAVAVASISLIVQGRGFPYHLRAMWFMDHLVAVVGAFCVSRTRPWRAWVVPLALILLVVQTATSTRLYQTGWARIAEGLPVQRPYECTMAVGEPRRLCDTEGFTRVLRPWASAGDRVAYLGILAVPGVYAMLDLGLDNVVRLAPLALADAYPAEAYGQTPFPYRPRGERSALESAVLQGAVEDLARHTPELVVIETRAFMPGIGMTTFDLWTFFSQEPSFRERLESDYREVDTTPRGGTHRVFVRRDLHDRRETR